VSAFASAASGETAPAFEDLLAQAATNAPRLVEGQAGLDIAKGQARQGAAWSNPVLGYEIENFGNVASGPLSEQQTTWTLTQPIELGGERWARAAAGRADVRAAEALRIQSRADFGFDLAMAYAVAETSQRRVALLEDDLQRANENARAARAFVTAGRSERSASRSRRGRRRRRSAIGAR
jgi:cobalt-zinc-cadmium efflux system outer membrane protein